MYGMVHTIVTIMYALNVLSRYNNNPGPRHIQYLKHLVRFVKYSKKDRLIFRTSDGPYDIQTMTDVLQLRFQCDADFYVFTNKFPRIFRRFFNMLVLN